MHRLPILIKYLRIPFLLFIVWRVGFITSQILPDSFSGAICYFLAHVFATVMHLNKCSINWKLAGSLSLTICHAVHVVVLWLYQNGDMMHHTTAVACNFFGVQNYYELLAFYIIDLLGLLLAVLTFHLEIIYSRHQEFLKSIEEFKKGPRVVFTRKLTENQDGFYENVYGEIHIDINGSNVFSYSY